MVEDVYIDICRYSGEVFLAPVISYAIWKPILIEESFIIVTSLFLKIKSNNLKLGLQSILPLLINLILYARVFDFYI